MIAAAAARSTSRSGTEPSGRRSQSARSAARPRARAADSGYMNAAATSGSARSAAGMPAALMNDREDGLVVGTGAGESDGDFVCGCAYGRYEQDDDGIDGSVGEQDRQHCLVRGCRCRAEHVDWVREARLSRQELRESRARLFGERRQGETGRFAGVGAHDPEPAGVRQHSHAAAAWRRLRGEQRRDVGEFLERAGADDAGLVEERINRYVGAGEGCCVRTGGASAAWGLAALDGENRLAPCHAAGEPGELARVAERLHVQQNHLGERVVLPPLEQVVRGDIDLVADRDERRQSKAARRGGFEHRQPERSALGGEADVAARRLA